MANDEITRLGFDVYGRDRGGTVKRTLDDVSRGADKAGDSLDGLRTDAGHLDKAISETEQHLRELIEQFNETEDVTLLKEVRRDRSTLALLESMRKKVAQISDAAEDVGSSVGASASVGIGDALGSLPSQLKGALIVSGVGVGVTLAPLIGAAVAGAVLGGVGIGGIIGGVAAASQDERVKDAGTALKENFADGMKDAGRIFIAPILDSMDELERAENAFVATTASGFAKLAPTIRPWANAIEEAVDALDPGLTDALDAAVPVSRALANEVPEVAQSVSDFFSTIADEKDGAILGLSTIMDIFRSQITLVGSLTAGLAGAYEWIVRSSNAAAEWGLKWTSWIPLVAGPQQMLRDSTQSLLDDLEKANDASGDFAGNLAEQAEGAREAAAAARQLEDAVQDLFGQLIGLEEAQVRYNLGLIRLREELKEGTKTLAINSEEGLKNRQAILATIRDIASLREAHIANNMPVARANQLYEQQMRQLMELAVELGLSRGEVERMTGALRDVPDTVDVQIVAHGLSPSLKHAIELNEQIDELDGRVARSTVITEFASYRSGERNPGVDGRRSAGGTTMAGRTYLVGENGPEIRHETTSGYVHSAASTRMLLSGMSGGSSAPAAVAPTVINFPGFTGDPIADAVLARFRQDIQSFGGDRDAVVVYFGGQPA